MAKERVDILLVEQGLFVSRAQARIAIMEGKIHTENERIDKPGTKLNREVKLFVKGKVLPYVSRGGYKLEKAIKLFDLDLTGCIMADIGSSTGGFTDCALQKGASLVYAIDVGTNQLAWKLREDARVVVLEKTNFRYADASLFNRGLPTFISIDVSFISLKHIFKPLKDILAKESKVMALIKPQFEAEKDQVGKKGIIKDKAVHIEVIERVLGYAQENDLGLANISYSPITGGDGNIEFITLFIKGKKHKDIDLVKLVEEAHQNFGR